MSEVLSSVRLFVVRNLSFWRIITLIFGLVTIFGSVGAWHQQPGLGLLGILLGILLCPILYISKKRTNIEIKLKPAGPEQSYADSNSVLSVDTHKSQFAGEISIPKVYENGCTVLFTETEAYSVSLSGHPDGVNTSKPNKFDIDAGVEWFGFIMTVENNTDGSGRFTMKVKDEKNNRKIDQFSIEL